MPKSPEYALPPIDYAALPPRSLMRICDAILTIDESLPYPSPASDWATRWYEAASAEVRAMPASTFAEFMTEVLKTWPDPKAGHAGRVWSDLAALRNALVTKEAD